MRIFVCVRIKLLVKVVFILFHFEYLDMHLCEALLLQSFSLLLSRPNGVTTFAFLEELVEKVSLSLSVSWNVAERRPIVRNFWRGHQSSDFLIVTHHSL